MSCYRNIALIIITFVNVSVRAQFNPSLCNIHLTEVLELDGGKSIDDLTKTKIGTINMQEMEYLKHSNPFKKPREKIQELANVINEEKLDIAVLLEVENKDVLDAFNGEFLKSRYQTFFVRGSDKTNGIGLLLDKELPVKTIIESFSNQKTINPLNKNEIPLFSRDLPALHIRNKTTSMNDPPELILLSTHYKSQRDFKGDPRSVNRRTEQVEATNEIIKMYEQKYPSAHIILAGDFNADLNMGKEFNILFEQGRMTDAMDLNQIKLKDSEKITHSYHTKNGKTNYNYMDAVLVNKKMLNKVNHTKIYRYKDNLGIKRKIPANIQERELNPSDHFPVISEFDFTAILKGE